MIMGLNIEEALQNKLGSLCTAAWKQKGVHYLDIKFSADPQDLLEENVIAYSKRMKNQLRNWQILTISWWGWMAVIKVKILRYYYFCFKTW